MSEGYYVEIEMSWIFPVFLCKYPAARCPTARGAILIYNCDSPCYNLLAKEHHRHTDIFLSAAQPRSTNSNQRSDVSKDLTRYIPQAKQ